MLDNNEFDSEVLGEANVFDDIYKQPNRKKCALLSWWAAEKAIKEYNGKE